MAEAGYTRDQICRGIVEAIKAHDFPAVISLLKMLAVKDPGAAEVVYQSMHAALEGRTLAGKPAGLKCPGCGEPPFLLMGGGTQAFCRTDDCPWFTWDPTKTLAEINASQQVIDLGGSQGSSEGENPECPDGEAR